MSCKAAPTDGQGPIVNLIGTNKGVEIAGLERNDFIIMALVF